MLYGGIAVAAYLFLKPKTATTTPVYTGGSTPVYTGGSSSLPVVTTPVTSNSNILPAAKPGEQLISADSGVTPSQYAYAQSINPNIGNPNYTLSDAEVQQYLANYLDLRQGLPTWIGQDKSLPNAARHHWKQYGAFEKRVFLQFMPPAQKAYVPAPSNPNSSNSSGGGGCSWCSTALTVAGTVVAMLGVDPILNDMEIETLFAGSAILKEILPMFPQSQTANMNERLDILLEKYAS
jgi:hypothetical protein